MHVAHPLTLRSHLMNTYKSLSSVGLAVASLFAAQAFAAVPLPTPNPSCPTAPTAGALIGGSPVCIASYGNDGPGTGLANYLSPNDPINNPTGLVASGPGINPYTDQAGPNATWSVTGISNTNTILLEVAGNASTNTFGIYDLSDKNNRFQLFDGPAGAGATTSLTYNLDGTFTAGANTSAVFGSGDAFGYYLGASSGFFFSDPTLNPDGIQQFVEYQGNGSWLQTGATTTEFTSSMYLLAWEDVTHSNSDLDYNDFMVLITANPRQNVPEPAVLGMFGLGVLMIGGFAALRRRRENI